ncbi:hypothetical protein PHMEG_00033747 [Phytophthora megakarya]|uniref:Uncharacterized protein n=1 Tax=Phytophthora megakarya TaxID=4795 RepID=A0A225USE0_9STRA|nr:hypothetical protein PHMEG_00033747 [Phytophthora megakarya]
MPTISPQTPAFIADEHLNMLRKLKRTLPNRNGKWNCIYSECAALYPDPCSRITLNALRCRLRSPWALNQRSLATDLIEQAPTRSKPGKRKETLCTSCRQRKKRRGDRSVNPYCMGVNKAPAHSNSLDQCLSR